MAFSEKTTGFISFFWQIMFTRILRKTGLMTFAVGVIIFLVDSDAFSSLQHLAYFAPGLLTSDFILGAYYVRTGAILLMIGGVAMFFAGKKEAKVSPTTG